MSVEITNPWTGQVDYRYDYVDAAAVEAILAASAAAFPAWSALSLAERGAYLKRVAAQLREHRERLAGIMSAEMGKLRREALAEVEKCAGACDYYASHAGDYLQDTPIATEATRSYVSYEPIGCVFAVMPWNFPIWQVFRFLAPALMAGNVALLKHATNVPRCADAIAEMLALAGVPAGVLGVLHIDNDMAATVIADPRVHAVTLTGSERAGRSVAATAGKHLKKCVHGAGRQRSVRRARRRRPRQDRADGDQFALRQCRPDLHRRQALHRHRKDRRCLRRAFRRRRRQAPRR